MRGKVKAYKRRSRRETESEQGETESRAVDPKPGDLSMDRMKRW